jgi:NAD-dependent SIR2 family protein deacetylase
MTERAVLEQAARAIATADRLLITAGAGMGVDSGLPDFRGPQGFWSAYPPYQKLGLNFIDLANPRWFEDDPTLAWGFYGHRMNLYRSTKPHDGFGVLLSWIARIEASGAPRIKASGASKLPGGFVFTSNVDGHFQRAGFAPDAVLEVHGSIDWLQCGSACGAGIFRADTIEIQIDDHTMRAVGLLPTCPSCGRLARPNILMFGDWDWNPARTAEQEQRLHQWLDRASAGRLVIIECGAGTEVPTVRRFSEEVIRRTGARLIRINVRDPETPPGHISIAMNAREALHAINRLLTGNVGAGLTLTPPDFPGLV